MVNFQSKYVHVPPQRGSMRSPAPTVLLASSRPLLPTHPCWCLRTHHPATRPCKWFQPPPFLLFDWTHPPPSPTRVAHGSSRVRRFLLGWSMFSLTPVRRREEMRVFGRHLHHRDPAETAVLLITGLQLLSRALGRDNHSQQSTILTTPLPSSTSLTLAVGRAIRLVWRAAIALCPHFPYFILLRLSRPYGNRCSENPGYSRICGLLPQERSSHHRCCVLS